MKHKGKWMIALLILAFSAILFTACGEKEAGDLSAKETVDALDAKIKEYVQMASLNISVAIDRVQFVGDTNYVIIYKSGTSLYEYTGEVDQFLSNALKASVIAEQKPKPEQSTLLATGVASFENRVTEDSLIVNLLIMKGDDNKADKSMEYAFTDALLYEIEQQILALTPTPKPDPDATEEGDGAAEEGAAE